MAEENNNMNNQQQNETNNQQQNGAIVDDVVRALGFESTKQLSETLALVREQKEKKAEETSPGISELLKSLVGENKEDETKQEEKKEEETKAVSSGASDAIMKEILKRLDEEKDARLTAEAKAAALSMGADPKLVDHLIIIAKQKATGGKDVVSILSEIKSGELSGIYFLKDGEEENRESGVTRGTRRKAEEKGGKKVSPDYVKELLKGKPGEAKKSFFKN